MDNNRVVGKYKVMFIAIMFAPIILIDINLDNDIWFLLNTGRYILQNGFPAVEPFSIHEGLSFIVPQWLSAVIFWVIYSAAGILGLYVLRVAMFVVTAAVIYKTCMMISGKSFMVSFAVTTFAGALLAMFFLTRPQIFSGLIFVVELYFLESFFVKGSGKYLIALPALSLMLINLHASMWLMFFVLALPYVADSFTFKYKFIKCTGAKKLPLFLSLAASFVAGYVNPYRLRAMTYLLRSYGHDEISGFVTEMASPTLSDNNGRVIFASIFIVAAIYILYTKGTTTLRYVLLSCGTLVLTLSSQRSFMLFIIAAVFPLAYYFRSALDEKGSEVSRSNPKMVNILTALVFVALAGTAVLSVSQTDLNKSQPKVTKAVDYIIGAEDPQQVVLYAGFNDGGYTEYRGLKSYIDPRAEVYVIENNGKADVMLEYALLQSGQLYYKDFLNKYDFTHLLVRNDDILKAYLEKDSGYKEVYKDKYCKVFCPYVQK